MRRLAPRGRPPKPRNNRANSHADARDPLRTRLTPIQWLICVIAAIGFAFDIYEILMLPLIVRPALLELTGAAPGSPEFQMWVGRLFYIPRVRRRHLRPARRLPDRSVRPPPRADLQHPDLRDLGVLLRLRHLDRDAAGPALLRVHRRVRRVRRRGGVAGRALPEPKQREKVLGYTQAFSSLGGLLVAIANGWPSLCASLPAIGWIRDGRHPESARAVALHADVRRDPGDPADPHPPVPARVARSGSRKAAGTLKRPSIAALFARAAPDDDRDDR